VPKKNRHLNSYINNRVQDDGSTPVGGATAQPAPDPSFFPRLSVDNVNLQNQKVKELLTTWNFLERKGRIGRMNIVLSRIDVPSTLLIMPAKCHSRYFDEGRLNISWKIKKRLGKYNKVPGLMETLTYDPKTISKQEAWASFGKDTRRFLNDINQYRKRRGWRRLHYLWVVEVQPDTGYPHVHIFFPNLKWLAPVSIIGSSWGKGRANIESPKKISTNCAGYISKYLRKMDSWPDKCLALLWSGKCRMYGFSRGFSPKMEKKEPEYKRWHVIETEHPEQLEVGLKEGGYNIESRGERHGG
jgi:hypothetical protein